MIYTVAAIGTLLLASANALTESPPHLAQAWTAMSTGDGEPGK